MASEATQGATPGASIPSLKERRQRYRQETVDAILAAARVVMQEQGVAALNLNEVARRLGVSGQALAKYFPSKSALYDALFLLGHRLFREAEAEIWRTTAPDWQRIHRWFEARLALACEHPDLYQLIWDVPVPGLTYTEARKEESHAMITAARRGFQEVVDAGHLHAGMPVERVVDILMAMRHGIIAEHLGKRDHLPPGSDRFRGLIPDVLAIFEQAWGGTRQHSSRTTDDTSPTRRAGGKEGGSTKSIPPTDPRIYGA